MLTLTNRIDMRPGAVPLIIHLGQYDSDFSLVFELYSSAGNFTVESGTTAMIRGTKTDGHAYDADATIDVSAKTVTVAGNEQMTAAKGRNVYELVLKKGTKVLSTANFILDVERAAMDADTIASESVLKELNAIIAGAETATEAAANAASAADRAEDAADSVSSASTQIATNTADIADLKADFEQLEPGLSDEAKAALLACFRAVTWSDDNYQTLYQNLRTALYDRFWIVTNTLSNCTTSNPSGSVKKGESYTATIMPNTGYTLANASVIVTMNGVDITSTVYSNGVISIASVTGDLSITISASALVISRISANYTQNTNVYDVDSLDILKDDLVVTAIYTDDSRQIVPSTSYTLSGLLTVGTSTITVIFNEVSTTFNVVVTDYHNVYHWNSNTNSREMGIYDDHVIVTCYYDTTGSDNTVAIRKNSPYNRKVMVSNIGTELIMNGEQVGSRAVVTAPSNYRLIPIPESATGMTVTITPSDYTFSVLWRSEQLEGHDYWYKFIANGADSTGSYHVDSIPVHQERGRAKYITINIIGNNGVFTEDPVIDIQFS